MTQLGIRLMTALNRFVFFKSNFGRVVDVLRVGCARPFFFLILWPGGHHKPTTISGMSLLTTAAAAAMLANTVVKNATSERAELRGA